MEKTKSRRGIEKIREMKEQGLIKNHVFTDEDRAKGQRVQAERKKMKEELKTLLKVSLRRGDVIDADDVLNLEQAEKLNISVQTAMNIAMIKRAINGDVQAYIALRDTVGEKPTDKVELDTSLTVEEWAKNHKVKL